MPGKILPVLPLGKPWGIVAGPNHLRNEDCSRMSECLAEVARLRGNGRCPENCAGYDKQTMHATSYSGISSCAIEDEFGHDEYRTGEAAMLRGKEPSTRTCVRCSNELPLTKTHFPMIINRRTMRTMRSCLCRECLGRDPKKLWEGRAA